MTSILFNILSTVTLIGSATSRLYEYNDAPHVLETIPFYPPTTIDVQLNVDANPDVLKKENFGNGTKISDHTFVSNAEGYQDIKVDPMTDITFSGRITVRNNGGCLNGNEFSKKTLTLFLAIWTTIGMMLFRYQNRKNSDSVIKHHSALFWLSWITTLEFMTHYLSVLYTNTYCVDSGILQFLVIGLRTTRDIAFLFMAMTLCNGWGITFSVISEKKERTFKKVGAFMLIPSCLSAHSVVTTVDMLQSTGIVIKTAIIVRIAMQFILCGLMVVSLNNLKRRGLNDRRWTVRLGTFKRILIAVHFVALIYVVHFWCYSNNEGEGPVHWRYEWIYRFGIWDILFVILLSAMMVIWKPSPGFSRQREYLGMSHAELGMARRNSREHVMMQDEMDLGMGSDVEIEELLKCSSELEFLDTPAAVAAVVAEPDIDGAENSMDDVDMFWV